MSIVTKLFYKDPDGRWYIDLPEYIEGGFGTKANLEMVAGADKLLDKLSNGKDQVTVKFGDEPFDDYIVHLVRSSDIGYTPEDINTDDPEWDAGGFYHINQPGKEIQTVWLCPVTLYVFNNQYPKNIYIQVVESTNN